MNFNELKGDSTNFTLQNQFAINEEHNMGCKNSFIMSAVTLEELYLTK